MVMEGHAAQVLRLVRGADNGLQGSGVDGIVWLLGLPSQQHSHATLLSSLRCSHWNKNNNNNNNNNDAAEPDLVAEAGMPTRGLLFSSQFCHFFRTSIMVRDW